MLLLSFPPKKVAFREQPQERSVAMKKPLPLCRMFAFYARMNCRYCVCVLLSTAIKYVIKMKYFVISK